MRRSGRIRCISDSVGKLEPVQPSLVDDVLRITPDQVDRHVVDLGPGRPTDKAKDVRLLVRDTSVPLGVVLLMLADPKQRPTDRDYGTHTFVM